MALPPTSTKGSGDSTPVTTFEIDTPNIPITHTGTKATFGTVAVAGGGTGVTSVTTSPAATAFAGWDANKNLSANSFIDGYASIATAASTTTLTVGSAGQQFFTGTTTQTVLFLLPAPLLPGRPLPSLT